MQILNKGIRNVYLKNINNDILYFEKYNLLLLKHNFKIVNKFFETSLLNKKGQNIIQIKTICDYYLNFLAIYLSKYILKKIRFNYL